MEKRFPSLLIREQHNTIRYTFLLHAVPPSLPYQMQRLFQFPEKETFCLYTRKFPINRFPITKLDICIFFVVFSHVVRYCWVRIRTMHNGICVPPRNTLHKTHIRNIITRNVTIQSNRFDSSPPIYETELLIRCSTPDFGLCWDRVCVCVEKRKTVGAPIKNESAYRAIANTCRMWKWP